MLVVAIRKNNILIGLQPHAFVPVCTNIWAANSTDTPKVIMVTLNDDSIGIVLEQHEGGFIRCTSPVEGFTAGKPEDFE
ncbi:unnamed protein product [Fusarium graminearum]|uniref:Chromosome 3, complete genome n=1 Tax=Gibberella zeae (strain ATCC MYA-4620 / CBS 123657 / FGSC 9075 / NRRL 31084 / PH-1) TaxID=229533 RepID=A0A098E3W9_GIBZE|nr:unnamed protein product [Fusarium graminearum]